MADKANSTVDMGDVVRNIALLQSPFAILGANTHDDRRRIVELAEAEALESNHEACQKARADLTNPRTRLNAEIAWLPGVSPQKVVDLLARLQCDPGAIAQEVGLPALAHLNLLVGVLESLDAGQIAPILGTLIRRMAVRAEDLSAGSVQRFINEDRAIAGFPEIKAVDSIESELSERKRYYRIAIRNALDRLPSATLIRVMTDVVDSVTVGGKKQAPELIDSLVDSYDVEVQGFLQAEAENAKKLIAAARRAAGGGEAAVQKFVEQLIAVASNWDRVAQPIQVSTMARGIAHEPSRELAYAIRGLCLFLNNDHGMVALAQRLTAMLQDVFAEVPDVAERVGDDAKALADIQAKRAASARR